jgi:hypothetical protein
MRGFSQDAKWQSARNHKIGIDCDLFLSIKAARLLGRACKQLGGFGSSLFSVE